MFFSRGKNKYQNPYTLKHIYQEYIKDINVDSPYYVTYKQFTYLCGKYFKYVSKSILDGKEFNLGNRLGELFIVKYKPGYERIKMPMDWKLATELGKQVRTFNTHSKGFSYRVYWNKATANVTNLYTYGFKFSRQNKRDLATIIFSGKTDYFELN